MARTELFRKWLEIAAGDLRAAELCQKDALWLQCVFHCQQVIEKCLKGLLVSANDDDPPYTHDLVRLFDMIGESADTIKHFRTTLSAMNPYYIQSRYPSYKKSVSSVLDREIVNDYFRCAQEIYSWCEQKAK